VFRFCLYIGFVVVSLVCPGMAMGDMPVAGTRHFLIIEDNTLYQNSLAGVRIRGTTPVTITRSKIYSNGRAGVFADRDSQVIVTGCDVYANGRAGINIEKALSTTVKNCRIYRNKLAGIRVLAGGEEETGATEVRVADSRIYGNEQAGIRSMPGYDGRVDLSMVGNHVYQNKQAGIRVENNTQLTAQANKIHDNGTAGIISYESVIPPRLDIYQNRICFNRAAGIHVVNGIGGSVGIRNNWIFNNLRSGIACGLWSEPNIEQLNIEIINNTLVSNGSSDQGAGIRNDGNGRVLIMNNIVAYNYVTGIRAKGCKGYSYNLVFANGDIGRCCDDPRSAPYWIERFQYQGCPERGEKGLICDPLFVNPDHYDFRLQDGSPAIDAGKDIDIYNDRSFPPSKGTRRNDMGATGGSYAVP